MEAFTPELFLIRRSLAHVKVCLHVFKHLAESLGERAEKLQVALLEPLSTEHQSEVTKKQLSDENCLWGMCLD